MCNYKYIPGKNIVLKEYMAEYFFVNFFEKLK